MRERRTELRDYNGGDGRPQRHLANEPAMIFAICGSYGGQFDNAMCVGSNCCNGI